MATAKPPDRTPLLIPPSSTPSPLPFLLPLPTPHSPSRASSLPTSSSLPLLPPLLSNPSVSSSASSMLPNSSPPCTGYTWVSRLNASVRSLTKISNPLSFPPSSKPRVKIPNSIFLKGEIYHREFIIGLFYGENPPPPGKVFGLLNHIWGKEVKIEIHRLTAWAYLIRIPSESLRRRILLKELWMIGDSLLYTGKWKPEYSLHPPTIEIAPIWVHLSGLPFDLITREGLSYVGSLLGDPIDVDDFTKKIRSHHEAHIKVEIDLTKPLPESLEIEKEDGNIITVAVAFPHLPPLCERCKKFGHKVKQCPLSNFQWVPKKPPPSTTQAPTIDIALDSTSQAPSTENVLASIQAISRAQDPSTGSAPNPNSTAPDLSTKFQESIEGVPQAQLETEVQKKKESEKETETMDSHKDSMSSEECEIIASAQKILRSRSQSPCPKRIHSPTIEVKKMKKSKKKNRVATFARLSS